MPDTLNAISTTPTLVTILVVAAHWSIMIGLGVRIILRRRPTGVSLAWLLIVVTVPFVGAVLYLFVGELWLPRRRIGRYSAFKQAISGQIEHIDTQWDIKGDQLSPIARSLNAQANNPLKISAIGGNSIELYDTSGRCMCAIVEEIDKAKDSVSMLFYIWESGGDVDDVERALIRASGRGVACRVMVDSAGSKHFLRGKTVDALRSAGVEVSDTMPAGILRALFARIDIRNHRKIITIDHNIAYTGSMNMVDPKLFKTKKKIGRWVDVMARVQGPAARVLDMTVRLDWAVESVDDPYAVGAMAMDVPIEPVGEVPLQVVPSGPDQGPEIIHDMLLTLIYTAQNRLVITTPYFVPSEAMLAALKAASRRGVRVTLVVPEKIDSILVRHASKSYFEDLLESGVEICAYTGGLLHAKTVTADDEVAMLGTVNMDKRSFWINFEVSLFAYDAQVVDDLRRLQDGYIEHSLAIDPEQWRSRPHVSRLVQNAVQLLAPIL